MRFPGFFGTQLRPALLLLLLMPMTVLPLGSQQAANGNTVAIVTFTLDFPASDPSHYSISVRQDGHSTYETSAKLSPDSEDQSYESEFEVSTANRDRIFAWAGQAGFFAEKLDSGNRKLAFTGTKTFSYQDGRRKYSQAFNYSSIAAVQQLTSLFQSIGSTLDFGRRLVYYHRYQKLALDDELKRMEIESKGNQLSEIRAVAPVLQEIFDDASVITLVRARAQRLLETGKKGTPDGAN